MGLGIRCVLIMVLFRSSTPTLNGKWVMVNSGWCPTVAIQWYGLCNTNKHKGSAIWRNGFAYRHIVVSVPLISRLIDGNHVQLLFNHDWFTNQKVFFNIVGLGSLVRNPKMWIHGPGVCFFTVGQWSPDGLKNWSLFRCCVRTLNLEKPS